jgi:hypothetical protein
MNGRMIEGKQLIVRVRSESQPPRRGDPRPPGPSQHDYDESKLYVGRAPPPPSPLPPLRPCRLLRCDAAPPPVSPA